MPAFAATRAQCHMTRDARNVEFLSWRNHNFLRYALCCVRGPARVSNDGPACTGSGAAQLEEEMESLKRHLAAAREAEERQRREVQVSRSQTDSAVAQLRGMQERMDALEVCPAPITRRSTS